MGVRPGRSIDDGTHVSAVDVLAIVALSFPLVVETKLIIVDLATALVPDGDLGMAVQMQKYAAVRSMIVVTLSGGLVTVMLLTFIQVSW